MFYKKKGFPKRGDIAICTASSIKPHGVLVELNEYDDKKAMVHISHVAFGRVKNIRYFVKEGKEYICKILFVDSEKNLIDASLKDVKKFEEKKKIDEWKKSNRIESMMNAASKKMGKNLEWMYSNLGENILQKYRNLSDFADEYVHEPAILSKIEGNQKAKEVFSELLQDLTKKKEYEIRKEFTIETREPEGIEIIKQLCSEISKNLGENSDLTYVSAPKYLISLKTDDFKAGDKKISQVLLEIQKKAKNLKTTVEFGK